MFKNKYLYFFLHVVLWIGYTANPLLNAFQQDSTKTSINPYTNPYYWVYVSVSSIILFYLNADYLFPKLYKKNRVFQYILILLAVIGILIFIRYILREGLFEDKVVLPLFFFNVLIQYFYIFGISTSYRFFSDYQAEQRKQRESENERLKSELSFLRSQISPHFMFNLLNSLVALARKKSDLVEPVLLKMSELLRYMLYEKDDKRILLGQEVEYLKNYVELQSLRFGKLINVQFNVGDFDKNKAIEPMLLIPFIENAFKHGAGMVENPMIEINLEEKNKTLVFNVFNKHKNESITQKDNASGIGLQNVQRRLELLYPQQHKLTIENKEASFNAHLEINLK